MKYKALREECLEANRSLPKTGLVDLTFGNVSVLDRKEGIFAIKPSGVDYDLLTAQDIVLIDLDGNIVEGDLRPSSDEPTHRRLLQEFDEITSVVHTHSRTAVAFAQAGIEIPCFGTTHADYFAGPVPVTRDMKREEIEDKYEWNTAEVIIERFKDLNPLFYPAVLVKNHGPFAWSSSAKNAVEKALALEVIAEMAWKTLGLRSQTNQLQESLHHKHFYRKHGPTAYYGQK